MNPLDGYWHVAVEPTAAKRKAGGDDAVAVDCDRDWVERRILDRRRRGEPIALDGRTFSWEEVERLRIAVSDETSSMIIERLKAEDRQSGVAFIGGPGYKERAVYAAQDVTDELIDGPPGSLASGPEGAASKASSNPRAVMVVYGRNAAARSAMFDFLRALKLEPLEWGSLVRGAGKGSPYVGEILDHAFQRARAVVVVLTGDDEAQLREHLRGNREAAHETSLTPQARPNVLFEAGLAFGSHPDRTVLVEIGELRPFSDIGGRHVVRVDGTTPPLRDIAGRLQTAGCELDESGDDWLDGSRFAAALELAAMPIADTAAPADTAALPQEFVLADDEREAIHDLLEELETIRLRITRAARASHYSWNFALPAAEYREHKTALDGVVREAVGRVYVMADDLVIEVQRRDQEGYPVKQADELINLLSLVEEAQDLLRQRRG